MHDLPLYTVQPCRKDNSLYGNTHFSHDGERTLCAKEITNKWWIKTNDHSGTSNCPKCNKIWNQQDETSTIHS